ncbi:6-phosphogluconolactonase [Kineobactrum salinum]|uniref:6-phosphogluconolactonase n=1 Tax=Kineobactrum salinum TaxID=2708301 RepID=A0A6C0U367_9GAMM|nr:6-phosphogluconolactonase [Kineobactrum salinum]QIB65417.1 6-phosphogluconolactonase [Kineobactrum salinum]
MNEWLFFDSREELDRTLASTLAASLRSTLEQQSRGSLALSGGSTPRGMLRQLAGMALAWARVDLSLVDERWVEPRDPDSNERLLRENLLQGPAASARFTGLKSPGDDIGHAAELASRRLAALQQPFTAVVLGMGADGHTASWFPQAANLAALLDRQGQARFAATEPVTAPHRRLTLTLAAVLNSHHIHLQLTGADKRAVLESAVPDSRPVASILTQTRTPVTIWWAP